MPIKRGQRERLDRERERKKGSCVFSDITTT